jgi:hypothetical protein
VVVDAPPAQGVGGHLDGRGLEELGGAGRLVARDPDMIETSYSADRRPGDPSTIRQQILLRLPERLLVFRTVKAPAGFPDFDTYAKVVSAFELEPVGDGRTRVRLTGTGYADSEAGTAAARFERGNAVRSMR